MDSEKTNEKFAAHHVEPLSKSPLDDNSDAERHSTRVIDPLVQRSLLRKCDWFILPPLTIMYLFNALDKA